MKSNGVIAEISLEAFTACIGGPIEQALLRNERSHEVINQDLFFNINRKK